MIVIVDADVKSAGIDDGNTREQCDENMIYTLAAVKQPGAGESGIIVRMRHRP